MSRVERHIFAVLVFSLFVPHLYIDLVIIDSLHSFFTFFKIHNVNKLCTLNVSSVLETLRSSFAL